jgi:ribosomal protein L16/L10AE
MGKGKGNISKYVAFIRKGQTVCELNLSNSKDALDILKIASSKLPIKTKVVVY